MSGAKRRVRTMSAVSTADAIIALSRDPRLESPRGRALRLLLHLFERREAVAYLGAG
jgi:ATP-dependent DNA helicase RecG